MGYNKKNKLKEAAESFLSTFVFLMEDMNWKRISSSIFGDDDKYTRDAMVETSIQARKLFPAYDHIISLNKSFVLGNGVQRPVSKNPCIQYLIDIFYDHKENRRTFTGFRAQERIQEQKDLTGEVFFKIYLHETTGEAIVRVERDNSRVTEIITEPGDADYIKFYKYNETRKTYDYEQRKYVDNKAGEILIPDIFNDDDVAIKRYGAMHNNVRLYGYLVAFGNAGDKGLRGYPVYYSIIKYLKAHRQIAEDAATMLRALSTYAWRKKYKGNLSQTQLDGLRKLAETITDDMKINKPKAATGSTLIESENVENIPIEIKHNASAFMETSRILMQQIASGSDKMEHYFGNPANANLATATSMELPMLKDFERQQAEYAEIIENILRFVLLKQIKIKGANFIFQKTKEAGYDLPSDADEIEKIKSELVNASWYSLDISVYMPDILYKMVPQLILSIVSAYNAGLLSDIDASEAIYQLLSYRNVDDKIANLYGDYYTGEPGAGMDAGQKSELQNLAVNMVGQTGEPKPKGEGE